MILPPLFKDLLNTLQSSWAGLPDKPGETPESTLRTIWLFCAQVNPDSPVSDELPELTDQKTDQLKYMLAQRLNGVPLAYLLGYQEFMGLRLLSSPQAMIPRKETEILGRVAVDTARAIVHLNGTANIIDICTGSGNIALAMAYHEPHCKVTGSDISEEAVQLALRNANFMGLDSRVNFVVSDLLSAFQNDPQYSSIDLITCNPPYISSANVDKMADEIIHHEPRLAFDGGHFGIQILTRLIKDAPQYLHPGGWLCFEVGLGQGNGMLNMVKRSGLYSSIEVFPDESGVTRVIKAQLDRRIG